MSGIKTADLEMGLYKQLYFPFERGVFLNILIVEDEKNTRNSLEDYIRHFGLAFQRIWTGENGRQAFEIFEKEHPEIVLTDIRMPGGDGIELACKIYEKDRSTVIIFLTAYSELELMKKAMHVNAVDYILKPVSLEELAAALTRAAEKINSFSRKNKVMLRGKFFYDLLVKGQRFGKKEFEQIRSELGFPKEKLDYGIICVENINLEKYDTLGNLGYSSLELTALGKVIQNGLEDFPFLYSFVHHKDRILNICGIKNGTQELFLHAAIRLGDLIYEECFEKPTMKAGRMKQELYYLSDGESEYEEVKLSFELPVLPASGNITEKDRYIAENINRFIACNYCDPMLKVNDIADELCYTSAYLCMVYKKVTGTTINDYLNLYRIEKSRKLLENGKLRLAEIASKVGYSNENYYSKVFKKFEGISPKEYQIRHYRM